MLKYLAKISMDIFPSVLATIIGAYIVNHYINARPAADAPAAAVVAPADAGKNGKPADVRQPPGARRQGQGRLREERDREGGGREAGRQVRRTAEPRPRPRTLLPPRPARAAATRRVKRRPPSPTPAHGSRHRAGGRGQFGAGCASPAATPTPTIWRAPRSSACASRLRARPPRPDRRNQVFRDQAFEARPAETKSAERTPEPAVREASRTPEAPRVMTAVPSAVRPLPPPITVSTPSPDAYGNGGSSPAIRPTRPRSATTIRTG